MSTILLYEDGCGNVVDENGGLEPLDYTVDQNEFIVEMIAIHSEYLKYSASSESSQAFPMLAEKSKEEDIPMQEADIKRHYARYTVQDKVTFFNLKIEGCMSATAAAKQLSAHVRAAQKLFKQYNTCPNSIFEDYEKVGRKCILTEEYKATFVNFIDTNPSVTTVEVTEHLLK